MRASAIFVLGVSFVCSHPANAMMVEFFEGNNCSQSILASAEIKGDWVDDPYSRNKKAQPRPLRMTGINDEIRSARISNSGYQYRGGLKLFDHPKAYTNDDWVTIRIYGRVPAAGVCIKSFDRNFSSDNVVMFRHPHNGLDGKVSAVFLMDK